MPTLWRLCDARWATTAFSGEGAALYPGRWNSAGRRAVYCAATRSLAALEILAHVEDRALLARTRFVTIPIDVSEEQIQILRRLPEAWDRIPPDAATRSLGDTFLENARHPVLRIPSAVVPGEYNYLLNPRHSAFPSLRVGRAEAFAFDPRLASQSRPEAKSEDKPTAKSAAHKRPTAVKSTAAKPSAPRTSSPAKSAPRAKP